MAYEIPWTVDNLASSTPIHSPKRVFDLNFTNSTNLFNSGEASGSLMSDSSLHLLPGSKKRKLPSHEYQDDATDQAQNVSIMHTSSSRSISPLPPSKRFCPNLQPDPNICLAGDNTASYETLLQAFIQCIGKEGAEIDYNTLTEEHYRIVCKERYKYTPMGRWLISEEDSRYENMSTKTAKYTHTSRYDKSGSVSMNTTKGYKIAIGGGLAANAMGGNAGANTSFQYNKSTCSGHRKSTVESKKSTIEIEVPKDTAIIVKELVYLVEKTADCTVELVLENKDKICYTHKNASHQIEAKKLWKGLEGKKWARREDGLVICTFAGQCSFYTTEHRMETIRLESDQARCKEIIGAYASKIQT